MTMTPRPPLCPWKQVTHHGEKIKIPGAGLPLWDSASAQQDKRQGQARTNGAKTLYTSNDSSKLLTSGEMETPPRGSLWLTCRVLFPESLGEHSKRGFDAG